MDFDQAIKAHHAWKGKLTEYIRNPDKSIKSTDVCLDKYCDLGKWIYNDGSKYAGEPEYKELKKIHNRFHKAASEVIIQVDTKQSTAKAYGDFLKASEEVIKAINALKAKHS